MRQRERHGRSELSVTRSVTTQVRSTRGIDGWAREHADYLAELEARDREDRELADPIAALRQSLERHVGFCLGCPAFPDCALPLMQPPAGELRARVSGAIWFRLCRGMAVGLGRLEHTLADGAEHEVLAIEDPDFTANRRDALALARISDPVQSASA